MIIYLNRQVLDNTI